MTISAVRPEQLVWRKIGDIAMGWMRDHIDPTEMEGALSFHQAGDTSTIQLMEMRLDPLTVIAPHAHDDDEIFFVVEGSLHWANHGIEAGGSIYIRGDTPYSFRTGSKPTRLLNFRARADHSFKPTQFKEDLGSCDATTGALSSEDNCAGA